MSIYQFKAAALAEGSLRARYTGKYPYAAAVLVVSTPTAPVLSLGVSDTSLADAVSNAATVITGDATLTHRDAMASVNNWNATTASHTVDQGDFQCELYNSLYSDVFGGASSPYAAAAGTINLKNAWVNLLVIDNDVAGTTSLMLPPPSMSKNSVKIVSVRGHAGTSGTPTVTRTIYDMDGNTLISSGAVATATDALLLTALPVFDQPITIGEPVVVRDTCDNVAHNTGTTMVVEWGFPAAQDIV